MEGGGGGQCQWTGDGGGGGRGMEGRWGGMGSTGQDGGSSNLRVKLEDALTVSMEPSEECEAGGHQVTISKGEDNTAIAQVQCDIDILNGWLKVVLYTIFVDIDPDIITQERGDIAKVVAGVVVA